MKNTNNEDDNVISDSRNHSSEFFKILLYPRKNARITPVIVRRGTIPGMKFNRDLPPGTLAYLVRGLSAGRQYRWNILHTPKKLKPTVQCLAV